MGADSSAVKRPLPRVLAPRAFEAGAFCVKAPTRIRISLVIGAFLAVRLSLGAVPLWAALVPTARGVQTGSVACLSPGALVAGVDSTGGTILPFAADSIGGAALPPVADSTGQTPLVAEAASTQILADSGRVAPQIIPSISSGLGPSYGAGVWCWDLEQLRSTKP